MSKNWKKEFDNMFWKLRVPKNTQQSKDVKSFISELLAKKQKEWLGSLGFHYHNGKE